MNELEDTVWYLSSGRRTPLGTFGPLWYRIYMGTVQRHAGSPTDGWVTSAAFGCRVESFLQEGLPIVVGLGSQETVDTDYTMDKGL